MAKSAVERRVVAMVAENKRRALLPFQRRRAVRTMWMMMGQCRIMNIPDDTATMFGVSTSKVDGSNSPGAHASGRRNNLCTFHVETA